MATEDMQRGRETESGALTGGLFVCDALETSEQMSDLLATVSLPYLTESRNSKGADYRPDTDADSTW